MALIITTAQMVSVSKVKTAVVVGVVEAAAAEAAAVEAAVVVGERVVKAAVVVAAEAVVVAAVAAVMAIALTSTTTMVSSLERAELKVKAVKTAKSPSCLITTHITPITIIGQLNADMRTLNVVEKMIAVAEAQAMPKREETIGTSITNSTEIVSIIGAG